MTKIGFIGLGNMGTAIIKGLAGAQLEIHGVDVNAARMEELSAQCGLVAQPSVAALVQAVDYVVLAVKPQHAKHVVESVADSLKGRCLISICAGLTQETLADWCEGNCPVVRVMPNTPALVNQGVFAVCLDDLSLSDEQKSFCAEVFTPVGKVHVLPEKLFDAFTAVVGSGPAYVFYFMEACIEAGVTLGLTRDQSTDMVEGLFSGSAKLVAESDLHISQLREMVCSPAGTTIRAVNHFDRTGTKGTIVDAVRESYLRSVELGKK